MTMIDLPRPAAFPGILARPGNDPEPGVSTGSLGMKDAGEIRGHVLTHDEDMVITHFAFYAFVTGGPIDMECQVVQVDALIPTGTLWAANTKTEMQLSATGMNIIALDAPAVVPAGTLFCPRVLKISAAGEVDMHGYAPIHEGHLAFPYLERVADDFVGGPGPHTMNFDGSAVAMGKSATEFYPIRGIFPATGGENNQWNNTSGDLIRGNRMKAPFTMRVCGIRRHGRASMGDGRMLICSDSGDILAEGDFSGGVWSGADPARRTDYLDAPVVIQKDSYIRYGIEPTTATNVSETVAVMPSAIRSAWPFGADVQYVISDGAVDGGGSLTTWVDRSDALVPMDLMIDQVADEAKRLNFFMLTAA